MKFHNLFLINGISDRKYLHKLIWLISVLQLMVNSSPAQANCVDRIASLELVKPTMEKLWQQLIQKDEFSWGKVQPYGEIVTDKIVLTTDFELLTGSQKQEVLKMLYLDYNDNWFDLLTPEEQQIALKDSGIGAISPYKVYGSDGRIISVPYDGCTRMSLLTEKARFSWYYLRLPKSNDIQINKQMLRNVNNPPWRQVKFSISAEEEKSVRHQFWQVIGYDRSIKGWWIAWVPEQGYFEIHVPVTYNQDHLQRFWRVKQFQYDYVVLNNDGTMLKKFSKGN